MTLQKQENKRLKHPETLQNLPVARSQRFRRAAPQQQNRRSRQRGSLQAKLHGSVARPKPRHGARTTRLRRSPGKR
jgi:hypothetical protein